MAAQDRYGTVRLELRTISVIPIDLRDFHLLHSRNNESRTDTSRITGARHHFTRNQPHTPLGLQMAV